MTCMFYKICSAFFGLYLCLNTFEVFGQSHDFGLQDSLRGALRPERNCFDVKSYELDIKFNLENKSISGSNTIRFTYDGSSEQIQLDLFDNMQIDSISFGDQKLSYDRLHHAVFIPTKHFKTDVINRLTFYYSGEVVIAKSPPWEGGFVWSEDGYGNPWVSVTCEGLGASSWWPNKDHLTDKPDSMRMRYTIPEHLSCISNGRLLNVSANPDSSISYLWEVNYPINNYNVSFYIGNYVHFDDLYFSRDHDSLTLDYYVLAENLEIAKSHFKQTNKVLEAFEYYFGKYPFWDDGYALIEAPYVGMEHQSAIAYGNRFMRGYLGRMIPKDMNFDYIIVHETAHEYFGNSMTCTDHAEMWIHESFATYMESLYVEYHMGYEDAERYLANQRLHGNLEPIIGPLDVNYDGWAYNDLYNKGAWILHTLRNIVDNDKLWFHSLKNLYDHFSYSDATSAEIIEFLSKSLEMNLSPFFNQYLYHKDIPTVYYYLEDSPKGLIVGLKLKCDVDSLSIPVNVGDPNHWTKVELKPNEWNVIEIKNLDEIDFEIASNQFLINPIRYKKKPF